ncbi:MULTISPECIES: DUF2182 domain-containing protein [unclassified Ruegeria]|uniref:DUF2182 domain-containing protein n=1 Tax=unclassified Ruegeria TaxID=2625375 RepID=UPI0014916587|nr:MULTISPECIES: DUF2182 domain-containing protein [unclassified Ruegeria]NOD48233.1 DUF2182 domain-containing protein [Ruegeria sp. HKCCD5849]NOD52253.1 DUF2182 domain-containing protein [Ruegeria sp. HKCCD5851]NOD68356.1 DUF2182 domain-containing protein [Ruegeria sp. HKCCD7303]
MTKQKSSGQAGAVERLLRQDTVIVLSSVFLIILCAAWYTVAGVGMNMSAIEMTRMAGPIGEPMTMGSATPWSTGYALLIFLMWWVMMIAMMTPSAAPAVLLFTALKRVGPDKERTATYSLSFLSGYLVAWGAFSLAATALQWGLELIGLSDGPMMTIRSCIFAGTVLLASGIYQFSELKTACLRHCQSPARFLADHNHPGLLGAFRTGGLHGTYCLGCCWALMLLLFVGGIMNLYWIAGIAAYVALEKLLPTARWLVPVSGVALIGAGVWLITSTFLSGS